MDFYIILLALGINTSVAHIAAEHYSVVDAERDLILHAQNVTSIIHCTNCELKNVTSGKQEGYVEVLVQYPRTDFTIQMPLAVESHQTVRIAGATELSTNETSIYLYTVLVLQSRRMNRYRLNRYKILNRYAFLVIFVDV